MRCLLKPLFFGVVAYVLAVLTLLPARSQIGSSPAGSSVATVQGDYPLTLILSNDQWGALHTEKTNTVFASSAGQLWPYLHMKAPMRVVIEHAEDRCYSSYQRTPAPEYHVRLTAEEFYWAQFVFQFSHEFCHTLCRPELKKDANGNNQWFEGSLCEASSVFVLRRLDVAWKENPPFPGLKTFAEKNYLRDYANNLLAPAYCLPATMTLSQWYATNSPQLITDWSQANTDAPGVLTGANGEAGININRLHARLVGNYLLPLFKASPGSWDAVSYLNVNNTANNLSFSEYLTGWYKACPARHKMFVGKIMTAFGITAPAE